MIDVEAVRAQIPACQHGIYMNTGWSGPSPRPVIDAIQAQLELDATLGPASPGALDAQREISRSARQHVADFLGATPEEIALLENTTEGINVVINGIEWKPGDEAVMFTMEHSSVLVPTAFLARQGVRVHLLDLAPAEPADSILARLRSVLSGQTRLVALSYVQYASGLRMPMAEICELTHGVGGRVLVDGAQAAGQIRVDLQALPIDFFSMPGQKWLLGPDGTGALFIRQPHIEELQPRKVAGAAGHYDPRTGQVEARAESIRKFELTTASIALRAGLRAAVQFIQAAGIDEIAARNAALASQAKTLLADVAGVAVLSPVDPAASTGLVSFRIEGVTAEQAVSMLWERWRLAARAVSDVEAVRVSLHFFNTEAEVEQLVRAVGSLASER